MAITVANEEKTGSTGIYLSRETKALVDRVCGSIPKSIAVYEIFSWLERQDPLHRAVIMGAIREEQLGKRLVLDLVDDEDETPRRKGK